MSGVSFQLMGLAVIGLVLVQGQPRLIRELRAIKQILQQSPTKVHSIPFEIHPNNPDELSRVLKERERRAV
ncbi:hypothetical protein [Bifidobacterium sp.]|jgi:hypothetical protein|uniref:hypothetical protein n=1 Tax=Bifidobacterium sp. TaxID=41200 RepID=UPI0025C58CA5|nr:hypothetical protein [Bifidobacterium sp.]MCI1635167.1 hypothetical protein [Bifidobacterium sp.]